MTLLRQLEAFNLDKNALPWFKLYLTDRTQLVSFMGQLSSVRTVTAGVPQGSVLGVHTQVDIFADDTTLLAISDFANVEDLENTLSREVSNVDE